MHSHHHENHSQSNTNIVTRHIILLLIVIVVGVALYSLTADLSIMTAGAIMLLLVHILAVGIVVFGGRSFFSRMIRKFHGEVESPVDNSPHHHDFELETSGETIGWARFYDVFTRFVLMGAYQRMMQSTVELANIQAGENVLDVGCGTGTLAIAAKKASHSSVVIHATDAAPEMIARAREKAGNEGLSIQFRPGLVEEIDAPDNSYNLVMNSLMMHHLPDDLKVKAFAEIYRVLKPGGRLLIVDFEPPQDRLSRLWFSLTPIKPMLQIDNSIIPPMLKNAGFEHVESGSTGTRIASYISARKARA